MRYYFWLPTFIRFGATQHYSLLLLFTTSLRGFTLTLYSISCLPTHPGVVSHIPYVILFTTSFSFVPSSSSFLFFLPTFSFGYQINFLLIWLPLFLFNFSKFCAFQSSFLLFFPTFSSVCAPSPTYKVKGFKPLISYSRLLLFLLPTIPNCMSSITLDFHYIASIFLFSYPFINCFLPYISIRGKRK